MHAPFLRNFLIHKINFQRKPGKYQPQCSVLASADTEPSNTPASAKNNPQQLKTSTHQAFIPFDRDRKIPRS